MAIEIERKYLLEAYPEDLISEGSIVVEKEQFIEQTYLALDGDQELRVRKITDLTSGQIEFTHTFKRVGHCQGGSRVRHFRRTL